MNPFSYILSKKEVSKTPEIGGSKFTVDDNIGESIHIHYRNLRFEMSVDEFLEFAEKVENAEKRRGDE